VNEPTYCDDCDNRLRANTSEPPWRWLCIKFPRLEGFGPGQWRMLMLGLNDVISDICGEIARLRDDCVKLEGE
jgi:hypothetical protein